MMRKRRSPEALRAPLLWVLAASSAWALVVTERILELHEGPMRTALIGLGFLLIFGSAGGLTRNLGRRRLRLLALLVLTTITMREGYHFALRRRYAASPPVREVRPSGGLWHPITTTDVGLRYYAQRSPKLLVDRIRIVLLTDLHVTPTLPRAYYDHVWDLVASQNADLILLAGDYASRAGNLELLAQLFARPFRTRFGVFAVLGNHDYWTDAARIRATLTRAGVTLV